MVIENVLRLVTETESKDFQENNKKYIGAGTNKLRKYVYTPLLLGAAGAAAGAIGHPLRKIIQAAHDSKEQDLRAKMDSYKHDMDLNDKNDSDTSKKSYYNLNGDNKEYIKSQYNKYHEHFKDKPELTDEKKEAIKKLTRTGEAVQSKLAHRDDVTGEPDTKGAVDEIKKEYGGDARKGAKVGGAAGAAIAAARGAISHGTTCPPGYKLNWTSKTCEKIEK